MLNEIQDLNQRVLCENEVVLDSNVVLELDSVEFKVLLKAIRIILFRENIKNIIIVDSVYDEIEKIKKGNSDRSKKAVEIYSKIGKALEEDDNVKYVDIERHQNGVDDSLIDYCVENNKIFISFDTRANIRYKAKSGKKDFKKITPDQLKNVIRLNQKLECLSESNLYKNLQAMFDYKVVTPIEYIRFSEKERFEKLIDFITEDTLRGQDKDLVQNIKNAISKLKCGEIGENLLNKSLMRLRGYNFGDLKIVEESLKDKYKDLVQKFLDEKNYSSFEDLQKYNPFLRDEELINGILKYYGLGERNGEKNS
ncbi:MAG: hypothetical protein ACRC6E_12530 [Fusobacteriaceae bacterium]